MKSSEINKISIGDEWIRTVKKIMMDGKNVENEIIEILNLNFSINKPSYKDTIISKYVSKNYIEEMKKVFHTNEDNIFGHSYKKSMQGPVKGDPVETVISVIEKNNSTKQAVITILGEGNGCVPCINVLQFLLRESSLILNIFARTQDIYKKFCPDVLSLFDYAKTISDYFKTKKIMINGSIGSAHIYIKDIPAVKSMLFEIEGQ